MPVPVKGSLKRIACDCAACAYGRPVMRRQVYVLGNVYGIAAKRRHTAVYLFGHPGQLLRAVDDIGGVGYVRCDGIAIPVSVGSSAGQRRQPHPQYKGT